MLADILTDPAAIYAAGLSIVSVAVVILWKMGTADSRRALQDSHEREREANAERAKAMAAVLEAVRSQTLVAERLDAIELRLGIVVPQVSVKEPVK